MNIVIAKNFFDVFILTVTFIVIPPIYLYYKPRDLYFISFIFLFTVGVIVSWLLTRTKNDDVDKVAFEHSSLVVIFILIGDVDYNVITSLYGLVFFFIMWLRMIFRVYKKYIFD